MNLTTRSLTRAALIAAIYVVCTFALPASSFGPVQFRVSEALTLLPVFFAEAVPALGVGCLLGNLLAGAVWYDVVFGALATLMAALLTRRLRKNIYLAALMPTLFNGLIVGPIVYFEFLLAPGQSVDLLALATSMGTVAMGEAAVCYVLGVPLVMLGKKVFPRLDGDSPEKRA